MFPNQHFFCNSLRPILLLQWCNFYQILVPVFVIQTVEKSQTVHQGHCPPGDVHPQTHTQFKNNENNLREKPNVQRLWLAKMGMKRTGLVPQMHWVETPEQSLRSQTVRMKAEVESAVSGSCAVFLDAQTPSNSVDK